MKNLKTFGLTVGILIALSGCRNREDEPVVMPASSESNVEATSTENTEPSQPYRTQAEQDRIDTEAMNRKMGNPDDIMNGENERKQREAQEIESQRFQEVMMNR